MSFSKLNPMGAYRPHCGPWHALFLVQFLKGLTMSRHILFDETAGLAVHAGFDKGKKGVSKLYAKVYEISDVGSSSRMKKFNPDEIKKLESFLKEKGIEVPQAYLDAIATDVLTDDEGNRVMAWSKSGSIDLANELNLLH
jgi:hypothetical protein